MLQVIDLAVADYARCVELIEQALLRARAS
jgi:hypothetical protein